MINKAVVLEYVISFFSNGFILKRQWLLLRSARALSFSQETLDMTLPFHQVLSSATGLTTLGTALRGRGVQRTPSLNLGV